MNDLKQAVISIEYKLGQLLENYNFLKDENEFLIKRIALLETELENKNKRFNEFEKKYNSLKVAKTIEGSKEDRRETKLKINALIRKIDDCILQLSE
jgi:site-specific DNA-adenine methylase